MTREGLFVSDKEKPGPEGLFESDEDDISGGKEVRSTGAVDEGAEPLELFETKLGGDGVE